MNTGKNYRQYRIVKDLGEYSHATSPYFEDLLGREYRVYESDAEKYTENENWDNGERCPVVWVEKRLKHNKGFYEVSYKGGIGKPIFERSKEV